MFAFCVDTGSLLCYDRFGSEAAHPRSSRHSGNRYEGCVDSNTPPFYLREVR